MACTALIGMRSPWPPKSLGGGWSSRLFQEVREKRGLSYSVFASVGSFADCGTMSVYAATAPERLDELRTVINAQLNDLATNGPGLRELDVARGGFEGATVLGLEDTGSRMARLATNVLIRDRVVGVDEYLGAVREVTAADVQRVLAEVLEGTAAVEHRRPRLNSPQATRGRYRPVTIERLERKFFMARNAILAGVALVVVGIVVTIASDSRASPR